MVWSSSLWGCELKRICKWYHPLRIRHPPCEDVSWKVKDHASEITETVILLVRMWVEKLYGVARHYRTTVILLVRMWVEKFLVLFFSCLSTVILLVRMWVEKAYALLFFPGSIGHPPCEDVSWKSNGRSTDSLNSVILLVRMWVEKMAGWFLFPLSIRHPPCEDVSWKNGWMIPVPSFHPSSSLWGCELKN